MSARLASACKTNLSPVNPARAQKRHKCLPSALAAAGGSTSKQVMEEEKRSREEDEVDELGRPPAKKTALQRFTVSPAQHKQFHRLLGLHLISAEVPFNKLECPWLR